MSKFSKALKSAPSNFAGLRLQIEYVPTDSLKTGPNQLRLHKQHKMKQLA